MLPRLHVGWRTFILPFITTIISMTLLMLPATANAAAIGNVWTIVKSPNGTTGQFANNTLLSVAAISDTNVWSVGFESQTGSSFDGEHPLIEHWNGSAWSVSLKGTQTAELDSVSASSATDAWAVGRIFLSTNNAEATLAEHWNGSAWSVVPMPTPTGAISTHVESVVALSATNAWAVGTFQTNSLGLPLIEHWDGTAWSVTPNVPRQVSDLNDLHAITAISANDIWAVGEFDEGGPINMTMHWDGTSWSLGPVGQLTFGTGESGAVPVAVSAVSSTDAWAVGGVNVVNSDGVNSQQPFTMHWNGSQWTEVATPAPTTLSAANAFTAVSALASNDVWAVGINTGKTFIEHWDGTSWSMAGTPTLGASGSALFGLAKSGATSLWAVGSNNPTSGLITNTLTLHTTQG